MTVSYEDARAWAEDRLSLWEEWAAGHENGEDCPDGHSVIWQERATRTHADIAALRALLSGPPEPSEPVAFGTGMLVIDTGRFNGAPAVFVADAKIGGPVGTSSEKEGHADNRLQTGGVVGSIPTASTTPRGRYVYFFVAEKMGMVKIGVADCITSRFRRVASLIPDRLTIAGAIASTRAKELETGLHNEFDEFRAHGEWFYLEGDLAESVVRLSAYQVDDLYGVPMWRDPYGDPFLLADGPRRSLPPA